LNTGAVLGESQQIPAFRAGGGGGRSAKVSLRGRTVGRPAEDCDLNTQDIIANPDGVGEGFFYQSSPSSDVFAIVSFSSETNYRPACAMKRRRELSPGTRFTWTAFVAASPAPPNTCTPPTNRAVYNPSGVSKG
jgi:hypothetical protein